MVKFITLTQLTEKGLTYPPEKKQEVLAKVQEITTAYGGKMLELWATPGTYDFISVTEYPDVEAAFMARVKLSELGFFRFEGWPIFSIETYMKTVAEQKVLATV